MYNDSLSIFWECASYIVADEKKKCTKKRSTELVTNEFSWQEKNNKFYNFLMEIYKLEFIKKSSGRSHDR